MCVSIHLNDLPIINRFTTSTSTKSITEGNSRLVENNFLLQAEKFGVRKVQQIWQICDSQTFG